MLRKSTCAFALLVLCSLLGQVGHGATRAQCHPLLLGGPAMQVACPGRRNWRVKEKWVKKVAIAIACIVACCTSVAGDSATWMFYDDRNDIFPGVVYAVSPEGRPSSVRQEARLDSGEVQSHVRVHCPNEELLITVNYKIFYGKYPSITGIRLGVEQEREAIAVSNIGGRDIQGQSVETPAADYYIPYGGLWGSTGHWDGGNYVSNTVHLYPGPWSRDEKPSQQEMARFARWLASSSPFFVVKYQFFQELEEIRYTTAGAKNAVEQVIGACRTDKGN